MELGIEIIEIGACVLDAAYECVESVLAFVCPVFVRVLAFFDTGFD